MNPDPARNTCAAAEEKYETLHSWVKRIGMLGHPPLVGSLGRLDDGAGGNDAIDSGGGLQGQTSLAEVEALGAAEGLTVARSSSTSGLVGVNRANTQWQAVCQGKGRTPLGLFDSAPAPKVLLNSRA